jgi:hypothetical protein
VLEFNGHLKPRVLSALVDRYGWRRKGWISESADRYGNYTVPSFGGVVDGGTTLGTEAKRELRSFISYSNVLSSRASDLESGTVETSLLAEYAPRSPLTGQTVAHRHSKRISLHFDPKLSAGT